MTLKRRKHARPSAPSIRDPGTIRPLDSEDQAGTYARPDSGNDTGESDEGVFAQGPLPSKKRKTKHRKEALR
ncbi:MAG: hypothetical protein HYV14_09395 [Elusimicrobia bacterium]|nr:hypothetical protein [Elusimicrobiota bacterium]